ncbi:MAG: ribosome recycling factor [Candidatus Doudnabacteria bacterium]|nr:ribosome recycling factor [bacterium]MDZ4243526.1 ribosome recycling factor [Candidatus Doudnabacteria bacterium]
MPELDREEFEKIIAHLRTELSKLRTGRANPALIEAIKFDYYGTPVAISQAGSISIPEPRQLMVVPWDKNALAPMEKAIREANFGFNPVNEGDKIRITLPELTQERRQDLAKIAGKIAEEARVRVRNIREEVVKDIKKREEAGEISEDDRFRGQEKLQAAVDEYNGKIKEISENKEKEIMTI